MKIIREDDMTRASKQEGNLVDRLVPVDLTSTDPERPHLRPMQLPVPSEL